MRAKLRVQLYVRHGDVVLGDTVAVLAGCRFVLAEIKPISESILDSFECQRSSLVVTYRWPFSN